MFFFFFFFFFFIFILLVTAWVESYPVIVDIILVGCVMVYIQRVFDKLLLLYTLEVMLTRKSIIKYILIFIQWII